MVPATISKSAWRGEKLMRSEPKRAKSKSDAMVDINSIPQHEVANGKGQIEFARANPTALSNEVAKKPGPSMPGNGFDMVNSLDINFEY
jgi:hypothetical protein